MSYKSSGPFPARIPVPEMPEPEPKFFVSVPLTSYWILNLNSVRLPLLKKNNSVHKNFISKSFILTGSLIFMKGELIFIRKFVCRGKDRIIEFFSDELLVPVNIFFWRVKKKGHIFFLITISLVLSKDSGLMIKSHIRYCYLTKLIFLLKLFF